MNTAAENMKGKIERIIKRRGGKVIEFDFSVHAVLYVAKNGAIGSIAIDAKSIKPGRSSKGWNNGAVNRLQRQLVQHPRA